MFHHRHYPLLLAILLTGCQPAAPQAPMQDKPAGAPVAVSVDKAAKELVERSPVFQRVLNDKEVESLTSPSRALTHKNRVFFIGSTPAPSPGNDSDERSRGPASAHRVVVVSHYRSSKDETILSTVDLEKKGLLRIRVVPHLPTPLSAEELEFAIALVKTDKNAKQLLNPYGAAIAFDPLLPRPGPKDRGFGHRIVYLLIRSGSGYVASPRVVVDLTDETVRIEKIDQPAAEGPAQPHGK